MLEIRRFYRATDAFNCIVGIYLHFKHQLDYWENFICVECCYMGVRRGRLVS